MAKALDGWTKEKDGYYTRRIGKVHTLDATEEALELRGKIGSGVPVLRVGGVPVMNGYGKPLSRGIGTAELFEDVAAPLVTSFLAAKKEDEALFFARCLMLVSSNTLESVYDDDLELVGNVAAHAWTVGATYELMPTFLKDAKTFKAAYTNTNNTPVYLGSFLSGLLSEVTAKENHDRLREFLTWRYPNTANSASLALYFEHAPFGRAEAITYTCDTFEREPGSSMALDLPAGFSD